MPRVSMIRPLINQSINRSINQRAIRAYSVSDRAVPKSSNRSTNQSNNRSSNQSLNQSTNKSTNQSTNQATNQSMKMMDIQHLNAVEKRSHGTDSEISQLSQQSDSIEFDPVTADENSVVFSDLPLSEILKKKEKYGTALHCVCESDSIHTAMELMKSLRIGAVLVHSDRAGSSSQKEITGIISTRDFVTKVTEGADPHKTKARDFMTESPVFAYSDDTAIACLDLMQKHQFRHLPVRDRKSNHVIGLVSVGDLVRVMLENYKDSNRYMKDFINGSYS